jgi:hypothetical protein
LKRESNRASGEKSPDSDHDEKTKILLFSCTSRVDFTSGDTILPTRITCYCRHHSEKVGFCIYFIARDVDGNIIATGVAPPILITDDHKATKSKGVKRLRTDENLTQSNTRTEFLAPSVLDVNNPSMHHRKVPQDDFDNKLKPFEDNTNFNSSPPANISHRSSFCTAVSHSPLMSSGMGLDMVFPEELPLSNNNISPTLASPTDIDFFKSINAISSPSSSMISASAVNFVPSGNNVHKSPTSSHQDLHLLQLQQTPVINKVIPSEGMDFFNLFF